MTRLFKPYLSDWLVRQYLSGWWLLIVLAVAAAWWWLA